jgi:type I restriction enzyme, S subunit
MKYKKYLKFKDSGVEWLGEVPEHWNVNSIKSLLEERKETNSPLKTKNILSLCMYRGVIPYSEKGNSGNKAKEDLTAYKLAYPGDIVLNSMNVVAGSVGLSKYFGAVSPVYYMLRPRKKENKVAYFNNIFQSESFQKSLFGLGNGIMVKESELTGKLNTIRMRIPMDKLNSVLIPYPPIQEQQQIAKFLDNATQKMDTLIQKQENLIKLLKEKRQAVISHAVTQGLNPDVKFKDSGVEWLGDVPEHWRVTPLRYIGRFQNGISKGAEYFGSGFPFINYGDIYKNAILPFNANGLAKSTKEDQNIYSVKKGDVFFTRTSETINDIGMASTCLQTIENATFSGFTIRFRQLKYTLNEQFSKYYFRTGYSQSFFEEQLNLVTRASLGQDILKQLPVLIPPLQEQKEIADYLDDKTKKIDKLIKKATKSIKLLKEKRTALISAAVTGKIDVREIV